jgi:hypothetical protein
MRKLILIVVLALALPTAALATRASSSHSAKPTVLWVLRGTLSKFTAASGATNGSISITVKSSNFDSKTLKGTTLTFATDSKTKVVLHKHKPIPDRDRGIVKVRAAKGSDATALQTHTAFQVIDKGASR